MADQIGPSTDVTRQGLHGRLMLSDTVTKHGAYAEVFIPADLIDVASEGGIIDRLARCRIIDDRLAQAFESVRRVIDEQNAAGPAPDPEPVAPQPPVDPAVPPPEFNPVVVLNAQIAELFHGQTANTIVEAMGSLVAWTVMALGDPKMSTDVRLDWFTEDVRAKIRVAKVRGITGGPVPIV